MPPIKLISRKVIYLNKVFVINCINARATTKNLLLYKFLIINIIDYKDNNRE